MSEIPQQSKRATLTPIQALQNGRNGMVRRSIFGTNPTFVETLYGEQDAASKGRRRFLRCRANDDRSRRRLLLTSKLDFGFATHQRASSSELFIEMLKILMNGRRKPLFLILDRLPERRAKIVSDYVASTSETLQFPFLPAYAPEPRPDELIWNYMKRTGDSKARARERRVLHDRIDWELLEFSGIQLSFARASKPNVCPALVTDEE
jgi:transposase